MSRYKAASYHFFVCVLIGALLLAAFWFVWYPAPTLIELGGYQIFFIIVAVDVVLGPLLTLVVFDTKKKSLKFDLACIATIQIAALVYGSGMLFQARPVYIAAVGKKFQVVQAPELSDLNLDKAGVKSLPWFGPKWVGTRLPIDRTDAGQVQMLEQSGFGRGHMPQLHIPLEEMRDVLLKDAHPISRLLELNPGKNAEIDRWLSSKSVAPNEVVFQPIQIAATDYAVILDAKTATVIGIAPFRPWE